MSDADLDDESLRNEERSAFEAVYPDFITTSSNDTSSLKLEVPVVFESPHQAILVDENQTAPANLELASTSSCECAVSSFPPIFLHITFPSGYPSRCPPNILLIRSAELWLGEISKLKDLLLSDWYPGMLVLDSWASTIYSGEFLQRLGFMNSLTKEIRLSVPSPLRLLPLLEKNDQDTKMNEFNSNSHFCLLCLEHSKGSRCLELSCGHIFCRHCLLEYWSLSITEGEIDRVSCPEVQCVRERMPAKEEDVARIVSPEQLSRLKWLRQKALFDKDPTIVPCPMSFCQSPVHKPPDENTTGYGEFRSCQACGFAFCGYCRHSWHGPIMPCPVSAAEQLVHDYMATTPGSPQRRVLETRYGVRSLQRLVARYVEEKANADLISNTTTQCPQCQTPIEKSLGCNHMTCARCKSHFCFRCGKRLSGDNPYVHFSTKGAPCFGKLFDHTQDDVEFDLD